MLANINKSITRLSFLIPLVFLLDINCFASEVGTFSIGVGGETTRLVANAISGASAAHSIGYKPVLKESPSTRQSLEAFCSRGSGATDILLSVNPLGVAELNFCSKQGVGDVFQARLGFYAIALVQKKADDVMELTTSQIYRAFAEKVPVRSRDSYVFEENKSVTWKDVDPDLPNFKIGTIASKDGAGSFVIFQNEALIDGCRSEEAIKGIYDAVAREAKCTSVDVSKLVQSTNIDNEKIQLLMAANPGTIAVISLAGLENNSERVKPIKINGFSPNRLNISNENYTLVSPVYIYVKKASVSGESDRAIAVINWYKLAIDEKIIGENGVLAQAGLVGLPLSVRYGQRLSFPY
jgi:phosphate transport system substrate-binding protein